MISGLLVDNDKIVKSKLMHVGCVRNLQIGKLFLLFKNGCDDNAKLSLDGKDYKVVKILSATPKLDLSKFSNNATFSSMSSYIFFSDADKNHYDFRKYIAKDMIDAVWGDVYEYGWLYYEVTYQDIYSKDIRTDIVYYAGGHYDPCIENTKPVPGSYADVNMKKPGMRFYASEAFEYDIYTKKDLPEKRQYFVGSLKEDQDIVNDTKQLLMTELADNMINNFRIFLAYHMLANTDIIKDTDTITIDGITWYNGFYNNPGGTKGRSYLFYDYIPRGWRLPTIDELLSMLKKHPLLRKELSESYAKDHIGALRNNVGMQCYYNNHRYRDYDNINVMVKDSNDYSDESCYFPCEISVVNVMSRRVELMSPHCNDWNDGLRPYIIMLVKMTAEEEKQQNAWAENVIEQSFKYKTISEIYSNFGVSDINDINSITFDVRLGDDEHIKTFEKKKCNENLQKVKDAIAAYLGNNDIYSSEKICVSFTGNNVDGKIDFDSNVSCDLPNFITKITPLLCKDLCYFNVCSVNNLKHRRYSSDIDLNAILKKYDKINISANMYVYTKNALSLIGVNHEPEHSSYTAHISKMVLHMKDGKDITINSMPIQYFNQSMLYLNEMGNDDYTENIKDFIKRLNEQK